MIGKYHCSTRILPFLVPRGGDQVKLNEVTVVSSFDKKLRTRTFMGSARFILPYSITTYTTTVDLHGKSCGLDQESETEHELKISTHPHVLFKERETRVRGE